RSTSNHRHDRHVWSSACTRSWSPRSERSSTAPDDSPCHAFRDFDLDADLVRRAGVVGPTSGLANADSKSICIGPDGLAEPVTERELAISGGSGTGDLRPTRTVLCLESDRDST